jgi:hypothetical protein
MSRIRFSLFSNIGKKDCMTYKEEIFSLRASRGQSCDPASEIELSDQSVKMLN